MTIFDKFCILMWKNSLIQYRNKSQTFLECAVSVMAVFPILIYVYLNEVSKTNLRAFLSVSIFSSFFLPVMNTVYCIVVEKERQLKDVMRIMGLSNWLHWLSWFMRSISIMMIIVTFIVGSSSVIY